MLEVDEPRILKNKPLDLINQLRSKGVILSKEDDQLRFKAPKGLLKKSDIEELKYFKTDILKLLQEESSSNIYVPDPESRFDPFPLTDVQSAYLLGRSNAFQYGGIASHIYLEIKYPELDLNRVKVVWDRIIDQHDMLRVTITQDGQQQVKEKVPSISVDYIDVSNFDPKESLAKLKQVREGMSHRIYETEKWPLFGIGVTKTRQHSILHFSMEFLVADWSSVWFLLAEFEDLYYETRRKLPHLELTFRDYVITERKMKSSTAYFRDRQYWLNRIDQLPSAPDLPLLTSKGFQEAPRFRRRSFELDGSTWNRFKTYVQKHGVTSTSAVMALYCAVLERWSKNKAFCLNLTVLNRQSIHKEVNEIVGDFTSVNMLAVDWSTDKPFKELVRRLNTQLFSDLEHRLFSGVEVLREINRRKGRDVALMPIVFTSAIGLLQSGYSDKLKGVVGSDSISQAPQVFIDCQASDTESGIRINWDVREGIFPKHMIDDMFQAFEKLLLSFALDGAAWEKNINLSLSQHQIEERQKANDTKVAIAPGLLHGKVIESIYKGYSRTAIIDQNGPLSYQALGEKGAAVAEKLKRLGCKPQERVAISLEKGSSQVIAALGILSAKAVYVPIDIIQPKMRRDAILQQSNIRFVLTNSEMGIEWPETIRLIEIDKLQTEETDKLEASGDSSLPAYIIFTSGSTGTPKGVVISHKSALNTIEDINQRYKVTEDDKILGLAELGFDLSVYDIFGLLSVGGTIVFPDLKETKNPSHWVHLLGKHEITLWNSVPALMQMLTSYLSSEKNIQLPKLRTAFLSGDWIPINLPDQIIKLIPSLRLISLGGATEASIWSIYHEYKQLQPSWKSIPYGRPLSNQGFRVLDVSMRDCPIWVAGELYISGHGLAQGYLGNPEITAERFFNHPGDGQRLYRTGDLGRYLPGGEIEFLGRGDNQVKIRGHRIELGEIESVLQKHPAVANAGVVVDGNGDDRALLGVVETGQVSEQSIQNQSDKFNRLVQVVNKKMDESEKYLNDCLHICIEEISKTIPNKKVRILEVGCPPERARIKIVESLANRKIDYLVTDAIAQNVANVQTLSSNQAGLRFAVFDVNRDYREQGIDPNSFDIVLLSVISGDSSVSQGAIKNLIEVTHPGGYLISEFNTETEAENEWIHFLEESFKDHPKIFFSDEGIGSNQGLFLTSLKTSKARIDLLGLTDFITEHLPAYMLPNHLQVVDALPLTANGKVDRNTLAKWRPHMIQSLSLGSHAEEEVDELENQIAQIWKTALGVSSLSKSQNAYDLGADSLIMAKIAGNIREMLNEYNSWKVDISFDNLLRHMLNFPTVEGLAEFIRSKQSQQNASNEPLKTEEESHTKNYQSNGVYTPFGGGKEGPLRVVFHAGFGTLNAYIPLLELLAAQQLGPTIGVSIKNTEKFIGLDSGKAIEAIAEDYANHLAAMGKQEFQLIGHCLGGFTAIEVARRLLERGINVKDLTLVDSLPFLIRVDDDWILEIIFIYGLEVPMAHIGFGDVTPVEILETMNFILDKHPEKIPSGSLVSVGGSKALDKVRRMVEKLNQFSFKERFANYAEAIGTYQGQAILGEMLEGLYRAYNKSFKAANFTPPLYMGDVQFLLAEVTASFLPSTHKQAVDFWSNIVLGDFQVNKITGDHHTCVEKEPHVSKVAEIIKAHVLKKQVP